MRPLALDQFLKTKPDEAAIEAFLSNNTFPLVEGTQVTFVYADDTAEAVYLKSWVYGLPNSQPLVQRDHGLWSLTIELPLRSRVEYKLEVVHGGRGQWIEDPLNPLRATDPFGANSVVHGEGYVIPEWSHPDPDVPGGTIEQRIFQSKVFNDRRLLYIYKPARYRQTRRYPMLFVHDGLDYLRFANLKSILDNLIHRLEIPDVIAVLSSSPNRLGEYADDPRHASFICDEVFPELATQLPILDRPSARCLVGASFGAVASLSAAVRYPGYIGKLLLQSGSFAFSDIGWQNKRGPLFEPVIRFMNRFRSNPTAVVERAFVSCGMHESLIYENRSLVPMLQAANIDLRYVESRDGHNWENWRDRLRDGLTWLFPGPLRMVYE